MKSYLNKNTERAAEALVNKTSESKKTVAQSNPEALCADLALNPFEKSSKTTRSPQKALSGLLIEQQKGGMSGSPKTPTAPIWSGILTNSATRVRQLPLKTMFQPAAAEASGPLPKGKDYIAKMRTAEEEAVKKCRGVLQNMKLLVPEQKNVGLGIQTGISELDELLDVIESYRKNWVAAEKEEMRLSNVETAEGLGTNASTSVPISNRNKRRATSPADPDEENPSRASSGSWQTVTRKRPKGAETGTKAANGSPHTAVGKKAKGARNKKRKRKRKVPKTRSEAVLVVPASSTSYASVLKDLRDKLSSESTNIQMKAVRKTRNGALLLEMDKGEKVSKEFCESLKQTLGNAATVTDLKPKATVEMRGLDSLTSGEEILSAIAKLLSVPKVDATVRLTAPDSRDQKRAFVDLATEDANNILKVGRIRIGWISCQMKFWDKPRRCFRCFGFGHLKSDCSGPDRKGQGLCMKCGEAGHLIKNCNKPPKCYL